MASFRSRAVLVLVGATAVWGLTFPLMKGAVDAIPPLEFLVLRFALAGLALAPFAPWRSARLDRTVLVGGFAGGAALAAVMGLQVAGLQYTTSTRAGFITGLYVVFTPLASAAIARILPTRREWACVALAAIGLFLLSGASLTALNIGDALVLGCALAIPFHILLTGAYALRTEIRLLMMVQFATATFLLLPTSLALETWTFTVGPDAGFAIVFTAIAATTGAFLGQAWAQQRLHPTEVALIFNLEPIFAALASYVLLQETLRPIAWLGGALMVAAMVVVALAPARQPLATGPSTEFGPPSPSEPHSAPVAQPQAPAAKEPGTLVESG